MLIPASSVRESPRNYRQQQGLWHHEKHNPLSMGCQNCLDRTVCGGLHVDRPVFDCLSLCCGESTNCDSVCRKKPIEFAQRVREVQGFELHNVARSAVLKSPSIPNVVPIILHGKKRSTSFNVASTVCLPFYDVIARQDGGSRYDNVAALIDGFKLSPSAQVILTGTATDPPLERWWTLGSPARRESVRRLREIGIALVTTPNFSLFTDRPRWDDLHSMKRIAIVHEEFLSEGMAAALHLNARTDRDWSRWIEHVRQRPEITHVAFEFATGAGYGCRIQWHVENLIRLAHCVNRPLHLVIRGGGRSLRALVSAFASVTLLDTTAFVKTMKRKRAVLRRKSGIRWMAAPTQKDQPLDDLLAENWLTVAASYKSTFDTPPRRLRAAG